ncbi:MBL fold metallo-hydrolase [Cocleimonas sp. KMM 6892]|uniref:MBL fold metallo-hydrolase n=1 Tax=unclassified Cocleimonas TaxID=2639732 RepID=UPI002DBABACA|nr:MULTISPECIES: MBL fold metallo-hydrolase [unclassified Cocleimonas]MEB8432087.1 MBL fold metallo-hydrolase [Cocleimonas sp. KMM 6892]MEC4714827.1 MBL fold metallo-hydrolase [Cocleimonas sp. KMM 6895]MEC4744359.1 MBL fold metallo-hydrolase [Cocleimonas sp. KMM 6896]
MLRLNVLTLKFLALLFLLSSLLISHSLFAASDLTLKKVTENVYAIVGELSNRSPTNLGNNATFGVVVTSEGVVLIDSGATYKGAERIHAVIKSITDKPIVRVINSGGQDHRWLGNGYFKALGAKIIASNEAVEDQKNRTQDQFFGLGNLVGDEGLKGTEAVYADTTFDSELTFDLGGTRFEITHAGQAHTPGDSFIWLPQHKVMFTGDIVYIKRMLGVGSQSNSKSWIDVYKAMAAYKPEHIIPGHGDPTTLAIANKDSYEYLVFLREAVAEFLDNDGDISDISSIDQSAYKYLLNFDSLSGRNAQQVFTEMEFE